MALDFYSWIKTMQMAQGEVTAANYSISSQIFVQGKVFFIGNLTWPLSSGVERSST